MGCISSKVLTKSGSFQETVSQSFQRRSNVIEEIILSSSKSNGDQFLALLCASNSSATRKAEQSPAAAELPARIETIDVSELLAGLEEESYDGAGPEEERWQSDRKEEEEGGRSPAAQFASDGGGAAGRGRSFRTVEEFDELVTKSSSSGRATPAPELAETEVATTSSHGAKATAAESSSSMQEEPAGQGVAEAAAGTKRRARARQLGDLKVAAPAFDFSKSGSLRDWLVRGGQTFSPGSYVTPRFGTAPAENEGGHKAGDQQHAAVFDPELVAQFERAMEQLSEDEERVLTEILDALDLEPGDKEAVLGKPCDETAGGGVELMMVN